MWDAVRGNAPDSDSERRKKPLRDLGTEMLEQVDESEGTWESQTTSVDMGYKNGVLID